MGNKCGAYSRFTLRFKDIMMVVIGKPINNLKIMMEIVGHEVEWEGFT